MQTGRIDESRERCGIEDSDEVGTGIDALDGCDDTTKSDCCCGCGANEMLLCMPALEGTNCEDDADATAAVAEPKACV